MSEILRLSVLLLRLRIYSYFEKGCRKKCTRQSRKVLWVVFSSLFFKEISNNGKRGHGRMFARAKGNNKSRFDSYSVNITFRDCRVHSFCDNLSRNSCIHFVYSYVPYVENLVTRHKFTFCHCSVNVTLNL